ncbi:MAG TPA: NAD(P)H-dependent oxidoreductase, partial [Nakamurella sp.]
RTTPRGAAAHMSTLKVIIASTRPGRIGEPIGHWVAAAAAAAEVFDRVEILDLAEIDLPLMNEPHHPRLRAYVHDHTKRWSRAIDEADAFLMVAPEYNFAITAPMKNALDYLSAEWAFKPVGMVSYGGASGGMRAAEMIKQVLVTLRMVPVSPALALHFAGKQVVDGEFIPTDANADTLSAMVTELSRVNRALAVLRQPAEVGAS